MRRPLLALAIGVAAAGAIAATAIKAKTPAGKVLLGLAGPDPRLALYGQEIRHSRFLERLP